MKKILLASTMLAASAGVAAADVSLSGAAGVGVTYNLTTSTLTPEAWAMAAVSMSSTTDGGLEVGAGFAILGDGQKVQKDPTDAQFGGNDWGNVITDASAYMAGSWGKLAVKFDNSGDNTGGPDITATYTNTWGNFGLEAYGVIGLTGAEADHGDLGAKVSYDFGNYGVYAGVGYDQSDAEVDILAGANASISGFTAAVDLKYSIGNASPLDWDVSLGYATGPYSVSAFINENIDYGVEAGYDLGGGTSIMAGFAHSSGADSTAGNIVYAGVEMKF